MDGHGELEVERQLELEKVTAMVTEMVIEKAMAMVMGGDRNMVFCISLSPL